MSEAQKNQITHTQMDWSDQSASFSQLFGDISFNHEQKISISRYLSLVGMQLIECWSSYQEESFCIAETGGNTHLNFLLTCLLFDEFLQKNPTKPLKKLFFSYLTPSYFDKKKLLSISKSWEILRPYSTHLCEQYPLTLSGCHRLHLKSITLDIWFGNINDTLQSLYLYQDGLFDCWLLDGLELNTNPDMFNETLFKKIAMSAKKSATIAIATSKESIKRGFQHVGFTMNDSNTNNGEMLKGDLTVKEKLQEYGPHFRQSKTTTSKDIAIIGGGISSACLTLALIDRGYAVTLYCKDTTLGLGASGNQQGALYPLLNQQHDALSELFANSFLYARNYVECINQSHSFDFDLSGLLQLYYDESASKKLDKILGADFPLTLVKKLTSQQTDKLANIDIGKPALFYPLAGWLSPTQMVDAIFKKSQQTGKLTIRLNHHLTDFMEDESGWQCTFDQQTKTDKTVNHPLLVLTTAMKTLDFKQCEALPLSAARGQVTHIKSTPGVAPLKLTLCHEGYLTPSNNGTHCMGATFKRHSMDEHFSLQEQAENKAKLAKCLPDKSWVDEINEQHRDANIGIRCTTRDHFPYMGALPDYQNTKTFYQQVDKKLPPNNAPFHNNLFILTGLGSRGLNTAPLLAETLASQIHHEPLPLSNQILNAIQCNRQWVNYLKKGKKLSF